MRLFSNPIISAILLAGTAFQITIQNPFHIGKPSVPKPPVTPPKDTRIDWIVNARYIVTMDPRHRILEHGAVAIGGGKILAVGPEAEIAAHFKAKHLLSKPDTLLAPGLIDTHTHAPMSIFRGLAEDKRLDDWLTNFIFPAEAKNLSPEFVRDGTRLACVEMAQAGITTYTDMYYFEEAEAEATKEVGVRGVLGETILGMTAPDHRTWQEALTATENFIQHYKTDDLITPAVAPHSIYTVPDEVIVAAHQLAAKYSVPMLIHLAEVAQERDDALNKRNLTPVQVLEKLGALDGRVLAAHAIYLDDKDIEILHKHDTGVAHCPSSNAKMAAGVARVPDLLKAGVHVGLGTDGFAGSNDGADLFREMDLASKLQKIFRQDPAIMPSEQVFEMATIGGARALGMEHDIGSIEEGKRADLILVNLASAHALPLAETLYAELVHVTRPSDVQDVFVNGKQIVASGVVVTVDAEKVFRKAVDDRSRVALK